jgi:hypothetical protein
MDQCECCERMIDPSEELFKCEICEKRICEDCAIIDDGQTLCVDCF